MIKEELKNAIRKLNASLLHNTTTHKELCDKIIAAKDRLEYEIVDANKKQKNFVEECQKTAGFLREIRRKIEIECFR